MKKTGINHEWREVVRILSTHKIVSMRIQQSNDDWIEIRQCTLPDVPVTTIYAVLHIKEEPYRRRKFVWHPKMPPENITIDTHRQLIPVNLQCGLREDIRGRLND